MTGPRWAAPDQEEQTMDKGKGGKTGGLGGKQAPAGKTAGTPPPGMKVGGGKEAKPVGDKVPGKG